MFVTLRVITLPPALAPESARLAVVLAEAVRGLSLSDFVAPVLPGVGINAGHIVWRAAWASEAAALASPLPAVLPGASVAGVGYQVTRMAVLPGGTVWRALVFRVAPAGLARAAELERQLLLLPPAVPAIRGWALSHAAFTEGPKAFTHVWEQEFDALTGLTQDYMRHPLHWGLVDGWFDAEAPNIIVDPYLVQVAAPIGPSVLEAAGCGGLGQGRSA